MITQIEASNTQPDIPELPLGGFVPGSSDAIQVRSIEGVGPVKGGVSSTPFATGRGVLFQGIGIESRNIVLTIGLNPNWVDQSMTSLRRLLYRYFMTGMWVKLRFLCDDMPTVYINGVCESFEPNIFSQDPEIQISIICNKPDFIDEETSLIESNTISLAAPPWDFGDISYESMIDSGITDLDYVGTAPAGFEVIIEEPYTGSLAFINATPDGVQYLEMEAVVIDATQRFHLNTVRSTRYVRNVNVTTGAAVNILAKMAKESDWPEFSPGANRFAVYAEGTIEWTLGYLIRYGGL